MTAQDFIQLLPSAARGDLFSARNLGIALWGGLAILTLALLIVSRTRWGQVKPLSKCVVLSIFAHILLFGYAYGTRLIFDYPIRVEAPSIQLAIIETDPYAPTEEQREVEQPWDELAFAPATDPAVVPLVRESLGIELPENVAVTSAPEFDSRPQAEPLRFDEPERALPLVADSPAARITGAAPEFVAVEAPRLEAPAPRDAPVPTVPSRAASPPRMAVDAAALPGELQRVDPGPLFVNEIQMDRLTAVDLPVPDSAVREPPAAMTNELGPDGATFRVGIRRSQDAAATIERVDPRDAHDRPLPPGILEGRRRLGDGEVIPEPYRLRVPERRLQLAMQFGATPKTEQAVDAALGWLASAQQTDGRWDASRYGAGRETHELGHNRQGAGGDADTGITGLALMAFLAAGHTHLEGDYRDKVRGGLEFLLRNQATDGNLSGPARLFARMYCHGIATLALSEAYVMTGDQRLEPFLQQAVQYTVASQHPSSGGWRYQPGDRGDMSQFGWQVMSLRSAELAGIPIPSETRAGMLRFMEGVATGPNRGQASYRKGDRPSRTMTAESLVCRLFLDAPLNEAGWNEAVVFLLDEPPQNGRANLYYWYYAALALHQSQQGGTDRLRFRDWTAWNTALQEQLLQRQRTDTELAGSWDPNTVWGGYGGRVYSTAMATLCLEVYYRYLPLYAANELD